MECCKWQLINQIATYHSVFPEDLLSNKTSAFISGLPRHRVALPETYSMKIKVLFGCVLVILLTSCARSVTPSEAASGRYKKCRGVM